MYFNNIHVLIYLAVGFIGCIVGQLIGMMNKRLLNGERIFGKESLKKYKNEVVPHYCMMGTMFILYIFLLYMCGIDKSWHTNITTISYFILMPLLISAFVIDLKEKIIPNRLVLTIFEIGLLFIFFEGIVSPTGISFALNRLEGMALGAGVFLIITIIGALIAGKEAMGMGDVKLMGAIGLFFGTSSILIISVLSFLIGSIISIILIITKRRKSDEYIPFGPFIVIAAIIAIYIPQDTLFQYLWFIFSGQWFLKYFKK